METVPKKSVANHAFGALKPKRKFISIEEETKGMEKAIGSHAGFRGRKS